MYVFAFCTIYELLEHGDVCSYDINVVKINSLLQDSSGNMNSYSHRKKITNIEGGGGSLEINFHNFFKSVLKKCIINTLECP